MMSDAHCTDDTGGDAFEQCEIGQIGNGHLISDQSKTIAKMLSEASENDDRFGQQQKTHLACLTKMSANLSFEMRWPGNAHLELLQKYHRASFGNEMSF